MYSGDCLCGGVRFRIDSELEPIQICHCSQCRKAQGAPFATNIPVPPSAFHLVSGAELLAAFESSPGKQRVFCKKCGSPIYSTKDTLPGVVRIRAGLIDEPLAVRPVAHFHTGSKANWWTVQDDLPRFEGGYIPRDTKAPSIAARQCSLFMVRFTDKPECLSIRQNFLPDHLAWLEQHRHTVLVAGSLRPELDASPVGACWAVQAQSKAEIEALLLTDPFWIHGLRQSVEILHWSKAFPERKHAV